MRGRAGELKSTFSEVLERASPAVIASALGLHASRSDAVVAFEPPLTFTFPSPSGAGSTVASLASLEALQNRRTAGAAGIADSPAVDFDGIIAHDVPAAIAVARSLSGAQRVHWIGHGLGGQFLVGHIASDGLNDIAAGVLLSTPVRFEKLKATPRRIAAVAKLLPESWRIPTRRIQEVLTVASRPSDLASLTLRMEGPMARALLTEAADDMSAGLIQQLATWHEHGQLTDRSNRFDYLEGLGGRKAHLLVVGSPSDNLCSLTAAKPAFERLAPGFGEWLELDGGWGHLDLIAGADARRTIFPRLSGWLEQQHKRCWTDR